MYFTASNGKQKSCGAAHKLVYFRKSGPVPKFDSHRDK